MAPCFTAILRLFCGRNNFWPAVTKSALLTSQSHNANLLPWQNIRATTAAVVKHPQEALLGYLK